MTPRAADFLMLCRLRQSELDRICDRFANALDEDRVKNAEMFDTSRTDFSKNQHPNDTMREIEAELLAGDVRLPMLLSALSDTAMEILLGLAPADVEDFFESAAALFEQIEAQHPTLGHLAQKLTEIKPQYAVARLALAIDYLKRVKG